MTRSIMKFMAVLSSALVLTLGSLGYQRSYVPHPCPAVIPNDYGLCDVVLPRGGYPLSYVYDLQDISVQGALGPEDDWRLSPFLLNVMFYVTLLGALAVATLSTPRTPWFAVGIVNGDVSPYPLRCLNHAHFLDTGESANIRSGAIGAGGSPEATAGESNVQR
jgi:hypothetical protein